MQASETFHRLNWHRLFTGVALAIIIPMAAWFPPQASQFSGPLNPTERRVNVPYAAVLPPDPYATHPAVFWFGRVDPINNYADVRAIYDDQELRIRVNIFDRLLWYSTNPSVLSLTDWDSVTLYLHLDGNTASGLDSHAYQFVAELNHVQPRANYQSASQGNGSGWSPAATAFQTATSWRGEGLNDSQDDRGWSVRFAIPFASLGLAGPPPPGTIWGLSLTVHDRDDAVGTPIPAAVWPEAALALVPATWGQLAFGLPAYQPPPGFPINTITIRQGLQSAPVVDAHVGGHSTCGDPFSPDFFNGWGDANYASYAQINIQNQIDVADWPCFSKYYATFPLDSVPTGFLTLSAKLVMYQFGNASGPGISTSWIQALTVGEDWSEATLTWNNAPMALENITGTWVEPLSQFPGYPGVARQWDVSGAVAEALTAGGPLRLVLYSADSAYHSGRYFSSSDTADWNAAARPTLQVTLGLPWETSGYSFVYLPTLWR